MIEAISAGCICLDILPEFGFACEKADEIFVPGSLVRMGKMEFATGGSVGNTGVALSRLGIETALVGRIGQDALGTMAMNCYHAAAADADLTHIHVDPELPTPYTVVLAPKGIDRIFLYSAAANDAFGMEDIDFEALKGAKLFHLGYPTAMKNLAVRQGAVTKAIFERAKALGMATSLDFSYPDDAMSRLDWPAFFKNVMPVTDFVFPSIEEILMMLRPERYAALRAQTDDILPLLTRELLEDISGELLRLGAASVALKCGSRGFYLRTAEKERLLRVPGMDAARAETWAEKALFSPVFKVDSVVSACGSGDTSIAGFLAQYLREGSPERCVDAACAVGATCVTSASATAAIKTLESIMARVDDGWKKCSAGTDLEAMGY